MTTNALLSEQQAPQFQIAELRTFPVMGIVRYSSPSKLLRLETEMGLGLAPGNLKLWIDSDPTNPQKTSQSLLKAHLAAGLGIGWTDYISLHLQMGWGYLALASKTYSGFTDPIKQRAAQGFFSKAALRYEF